MGPSSGSHRYYKPCVGLNRLTGWPVTDIVNTANARMGSPDGRPQVILRVRRSGWSHRSVLRRYCKHYGMLDVFTG